MSRMLAKIALCCGFLVQNLPAGLYNPKSFTLENGLTVVVVENHRAPVVGQFLWFKVGSCDDPVGKSGIAHFMEHLRFKGPKGSASDEITPRVEEIGGQENASTYYDFTNYYQVVATPHLERIMKLEAERLRALQTLPEQAINELKVVQEERRMRIDNDPLARFNEAYMSLFYRYTPYRIPVIGWPHEIAKLTLKDAQDVYERWYAPGNAILVLAGDITLARAKELAKKYYGPVPKRSLPKCVRLEEPFPIEGHMCLNMAAQDIQVPFLMRAYRAPNYEEEKARFRYSAQVLENILGTAPTGFLYRTLVKEQKLATSVSVTYGVFVQGPTDLNILVQPTQKTSLDHLENALENTLEAFLEKGITQEVLDKAKTRMIAGLILRKDSPLAGNQEFGYGLVMGMSLDELDRWDEKIQSVTLDEVKILAKKVLTNPARFTGTLVPKKDAKAGETS